MADPFRKELRRKAFHQLTLLYLGAYWLLGYPRAAWFLAGWTLLVLLVEILRLRAAWMRAFIERFFGSMIREKEASRFTGSFYVTLGVALTVALYGRIPAVVGAAIAALALGDAVSPLVGMRFGWKPYTIRGTLRSVDGTLAGYIVVVLIGLGFGFPLKLAAPAALAFTLVDTVPVKPDDNFWIPVAYSTALVGLGKVL